MTAHARIALCLTVGALVGATPAWAAPGSDEDTLIGQGLGFREKGDDEAALRTFKEAYERFKSARALAQVALAEQALGRWVDADAHLAEALRREADPWIAKNAALLRQAMNDIQGRLGWLQLSGTDVRADVLINGQPAGQMPVGGPLRVLAGSLALEVRAPGYLPVVRNVSVPAGGTARESITLIRVADSNASVAPPPNAPPPALVERPTIRDNAWSTRRKLAVGSLAAGGAFLGGGVAFMILHNNKAGEYKDAGCATVLTNQGPPGCSDKADSANLTETLSIIGYAGAGVLAGAGLYLLLTEDQPASNGGPSTSISLRCAPALNAGVTCAGTF